MTLLRRLVVAVLVAAAPAAGLSAHRAAAASPAPSVGPLPAQPAFGADAPDPDVLRLGSSYYAYTTGTTWGNHIGVLVSPYPDTGYRTTTGRTWGSTALGPVPAWEQDNTQTSPGVLAWAGGYAMFYDAVDRATGHYCISVATASSPAGPFLDSSAGPLVCQTSLGGSVDPSPFVDPSGQAWLYWKSNDGSSAQPAHIWAATIGAGATGAGQPAVTGTPVMVLDQDTVAHPWETTVENPDMVTINGGYYLFFAGGGWQSAGYAEGYAVCSGPAGPCVQPQAGPILTSYPGATGPAAGNVFTSPDGRTWISYAAWTGGCTSYGCGGSRELFVAPLAVAGGAASGAQLSGTPAGCTGSIGPGQVVGMAPAAGGTGYWLADSAGGVATCGTAPALGGLGGRTLSHPVVGAAATPDRKGYWLVASDGGVFTFGDAGYFGSTGALRLARPIVGMAATPDGRGYWLVASDGGVFTFGNAGFFGSTGALRLARPVVGMAASPDGRGYWLVASDGGVFTFGNAGFFGSRAGTAGAPVVDMASSADGAGYWLEDAGGSVSGFGDARPAGS